MRECWVVILSVDRPVTWRPTSRASNKATDNPAVVTPTIPAPTMATSALCEPPSFGYDVFGVVAVQQHCQGAPQRHWTQGLR